MQLGSVANWAEEDVPRLVANKLGIDEKSAKSRLNGQVSRMLTKSIFEQAGTWSEVEGWFIALKQIADTLGESDD